VLQELAPLTQGFSARNARIDSPAVEAYCLWGNVQRQLRTQVSTIN